MTVRLEYPDARVARTRKQLKTALLGCLEEKKLHELKVKEVADRAGVNRVTFYDHYASLEALLWDLVEDKLAEYGAIIDSKERPPADWENALQTHMQKVILTVRHIRDNAAFYRVMLLGNGESYVAERLHDRLCQSLFGVLSKLEPAPREVNLQLFVHWMMGGSISLFKYWLQHDAELSETVLVEQLRNLSGVVNKSAV